jgi:hypothetical protein
MSNTFTNETLWSNNIVISAMKFYKTFVFILPKRSPHQSSWGAISGNLLPQKNELAHVVGHVGKLFSKIAKFVKVHVESVKT